jgi:hypothetical protein
MKLLTYTIKALTFAIQFNYAYLTPHFHDSHFFLPEQIKKLPDYTKIPFNLFLFFFSILPIFKTGLVFHKLTVEKQLIIIEEWRTSKLRFKNDFIFFFESLVIFDLTSKESFN